MSWQLFCGFTFCNAGRSESGMMNMQAPFGMNAGKAASLIIVLIFAFCRAQAEPSPQPRTPPAAAPVAGEDLLGEYTYRSGNGRDAVLISVTITREAGELAFSLEAAHPDAHGAAPEGGGTGSLDPDGTLRFAYEDSFSNKGTGTFKRTARGYALSIHIDEVNDPRCLPFYGDFTLQRTHKKKRPAR
jgi:hypothetical protein